MDQPTQEGERRIQRWQRAVETIKRLKSELSSAECELANATSNLGNWMMPDDVKEGETIGVWYGDELISVTKTDAKAIGDYEIKPRKSQRKSEK